MSFIPDHVEHPDAYANAVRARIQANARKGRGARWLAEVADRAALVERLSRASGSFLAKMAESYEEWGSLTDKQEAAVRAAFGKADARKAEARIRDYGSHHLGDVGKRQDFRLTVRSIVEIENDFGLLVITIMADEAGNIVVYKGRALGISYDEGRAWKPAKRGDAIAFKATVKDHAEREGVKQTVVARPKVLTIESGEAR